MDGEGSENIRDGRATYLNPHPVNQEGGRTRIGMVKPTALLGIFPGAEALKPVAEEVERETIQMIEEGK